MNMELSESLQLDEANYANKMVLENVKVCGLTSKNNREYPIHVLQEALNLYEGHPVYLDHTNENRNRKYCERVGHISRPQIKEDGLYANLHVNPHHELAEALWWDFSNNTKKIGVSQVVEAEMNGNKVIKINDVKSIDIVNNPATTYSLREEVESKAVAISQAQVEVAELKGQILQLREEVKLLLQAQQDILTEVENIKTNERPVAIAPQVELPSEEPLSAWVNKIKKGK